MSKVTYAPGSEELTRKELLEVGRRLTRSTLEEIDLLDVVRRAELDAFWRARAAAELLTKRSEVLEESDDLRRQVLDPDRGSADMRRITSHPRGRRLPPPGTVIIKKHRYQNWNAPDAAESVFTEFRFVVIDPRGGLLLLGDDRDVVYGSPSAAATAATGNTAAKGWDFFGIS